MMIEKELDGILGAQPKRNEKQNLEYVLERFSLHGPEERMSRCWWSFGRERILYDLEDMGLQLQKKELIERAVKHVNGKRKDRINAYLATEFYPVLADSLQQLYLNHQYGWLKYQEKQGSSIYQLGEQCRAKVNEAKKAIKDRKILHEVHVHEAESYAGKHAEELGKVYKDAYGSPRNRAVLTKAADLLVLAKENGKAEKHYEQAGRYEYEHAAHMFENAKDYTRAKKFWVLAAENPTGYMDEVDEKAGAIWEKIGNIPKAIERYQEAVSCYRIHEGTYDLHGDPNPGDYEANILEKKVAKLKKILAKGK
jgi:hypothetical protein